jgi:hypothetical protein
MQMFVSFSVACTSTFMSTAVPAEAIAMNTGIFTHDGVKKSKLH